MKDRANKDIMSDKEKTFVANFLIKSIANCSIDYNMIFKGEKIALQEVEEKEVKKYFGKQSKRSKKFQRESLNSDVSKVLNMKVLYSQFYDTLAILNNVEIDEETRNELEMDLFDTIHTEFTGLSLKDINIAKFIHLLKNMFSIYTQKDKIFSYFLIEFIKSHGFKDTKLFDSFLKGANLKIPVYKENKQFYLGLLKTASGISLSNFLLKNNKEFQKYL